MRVRTIGMIAGMVSAGLAVFAAAGFGDEEAELRSFDGAYSTQQAAVHRVGQPTGQAGAAATGHASKAKKAKLWFFETAPVPVGGGAAVGRDLVCPKGKVVTGYFVPSNEATVLGLSALSSGTSWTLGVRNLDAAAAQVILGVVCETGVTSSVK